MYTIAIRLTIDFPYLRLRDLYFYMRWNIICDFCKIENKFSSLHMRWNIIICDFSKITNKFCI